MGMREEIQAELAEAFDDSDGLADAVKSVTGVRKVAGEYYPDLGGETPETTVTYSGRGVLGSYLSKEIDGSLIQTTDKKLLAQAPGARAHELHLLGLALAACEKTVQIVYEDNLRPAEKRHEPWIDRVTGQLLAAYSLLEKHLAQTTDATPTQAALAAAVAWSFTQLKLPTVLDPKAFPNLQRHAD